MKYVINKFQNIWRAIIYAPKIIRTICAIYYNWNTTDRIELVIEWMFVSFLCLINFIGFQ